MSRWRFSIDVGGTFTDCVGYGPDGTVRVVKTLSADSERPPGISAPIFAIRQVLGLDGDEPVPPVSVRLGTTRGTNALLTRDGARTLFVTTKGFADVLSIGTQARPRLFDLTIRKPTPLYHDVLEIDERTASDGTVLKRIEAERVTEELRQYKRKGVTAVAIALINSWTAPGHEIVVDEIARSVGFRHVTRSSALSPVIRIVPRGNTAVLDAWLDPVLRDYIDEIARDLGEGSELRIMTSGGGLVSGKNFSGRHSILSGPAGGVIGYARVAERSGAAHAIGFDMGGTSTDVSRYSGGFEREYETEKAGVPIYSPTLAIETVAAGGGSICGFDGVRLFVGPASAGAEPGPACYGRGGPLTVTDMNLVLGRILPDNFPFPLDVTRVEQLLDRRRAEIAASPLGREYSREELAAGYLRIADERMVRAIRKISVAKGYDPANHVLVPFGGAGAQHACSVARELGITSILLHPDAGVLSAWGIGFADVRAIREVSVLAELDSDDRDGIVEVFQGLDEEAIRAVRDEGIEGHGIDRSRRSLELRYLGLESSIEVDEPADGDWRSAYESEHERLYGFRQPGRPIEIVTARVEVVGHTDIPDEDEERHSDGSATPYRTTGVWFEGKREAVPVYRREDLPSNSEISGPAIICESTSTIVVEPGWRVEILSDGAFRIEDIDEVERRSKNEVGSDVADPVLVEIFNNLFVSIAEQMGERLRKTSISTNVKERLDYSCALFSPSGELVANAPHIPVHLGAMGETVKQILADNPLMEPGDVFVTNDPYRGGSHLPDVTVVSPVHDRERGDLLFLTASRAHHAEIGGITPGSMPPFSRTLAEEGVLISNFRLFAAGENREQGLEELLTSAKYPSRDPSTNIADIRAQVAANRRGEELLRELLETYSLDVVTNYMGHVRRGAAEKMRAVLRSIEPGTYSFTDHLDDGSPLSVEVSVSDGRATIDFAGTGPVLASNLNANRAITTAAVMYVLRCMIAEEIPLNSGVLEPIEILIPECLLNPAPGDSPEDSPGVVGGNVETSQRVVDLLLGAFNLAAASQGTMNNVTFGDESFGYYETICGGSGATDEGPGADAVHTHMTNTRLTDVEVIEHRYPVRINRFEVRRGSGGYGKHPGGDGVVREFEFLEPLELSVLSQRRGDYSPWGIDGGGPGEIGINTIVRRNGTSCRVEGSGLWRMDRGDRFVIQTPGGGGAGKHDA